MYLHRIKAKLFNNEIDIKVNKFIVIVGFNGTGKTIFAKIIEAYLNEGIILNTIKLFTELKLYFIDDSCNEIIKDLTKQELIEPFAQVKDNYEQIIKTMNLVYKEYLFIVDKDIYLPNSIKRCTTGLANSIRYNLLSKINCNPVKVFKCPEESHGYNILNALDLVIRGYSGICIIITYSPEVFRQFDQNEGIILEANE